MTSMLELMPYLLVKLDSANHTLSQYGKKMFQLVLKCAENLQKLTFASKTQRHLGIFYSPYIDLKPHGVFVSLRHLLNIFLNQTINPKAQRKKESVVKKENLSLKSHYAYDSFVPSVFFICPKNVTGPKRLKAHASKRSDNPLCIYSFGAFFLTTFSSLPIKSRRGAGAIYRHVTSFYFNCCLTFMTKRSAIASCTFAVSFWFTKKVTGPKRLRSNVSLVCCQSFFLFAFGAFLFLHLFDIQNIDGRKGAGAIPMHLTSLKFCRLSSLYKIKRNAIASCTFAVSFWFTKKVTGPKRLRSNVSLVCCQSFFLFAFGAFLFLHLFDIQNIDGRKGAVAILRHVTSLYYYGCLTFMTKKRKAIAYCTFAVFFFFLFYAPNECLIHTQKNSKWREYVSI